MKTIFDQISITSVCRHLSKLAHTLVGKPVPLQLGGHGFNPTAGNMQDTSLGGALKKRGKFFGLFLPFYALILFPLLGTPENGGVM